MGDILGLDEPVVEVDIREGRIIDSYGELTILSIRLGLFGGNIEDLVVGVTDRSEIDQGGGGDVLVLDGELTISLGEGGSADGGVGGCACLGVSGSGGGGGDG